MSYSPPERRYLEDIRNAVASDTDRPRDAFLCHAWADRATSATDLVAALVDLNVDTWFSENDVVLGKSLARQLDAGLRVSRIGIVLVTPNMLAALRNGGFADQELGALLSTERVIPVLHEATYEDLKAESPLLAARAGLSTHPESQLADVAAKIAESVFDLKS